MNYQRIYNQLIEKRQKNLIPKDVYSELHHILPKCLGGTDDKLNLVRLTAREHFVAHMLLVEIYRNNTFKYHKMLRAFMLMKGNNKFHKRYINSRLYEKYKQEFSVEQSKSQTGELNSQYGSCWITKDLLNKKISLKELDHYLEDGWKVGRLMKSTNLVWIKNTKINQQKLILKTEIQNYPNWTRGKLPSKNKGKIWIYNLSLEQNKFISSDKLEFFLKDNWKLGRVLDFNKFKIKSKYVKVLYQQYIQSDYKSLLDYYNNNEFDFTYQTLHNYFKKYI